MKLHRLGIAVAVAIGMQAAPALSADIALDYEYFKTRVEPIFLKKRPEHTRCFVCHADANNAFKLQKLSDKKEAAWTDEESRKNFILASALVTPGNPDKSHLLMYPLAPEAGGTIYHSGGRQFATKNDPDWKNMAAWVNGASLKAAPDKKQ